MEVKIKAIGTKPLLLHNVDLANPFGEWYQRLRDLSGTPSKRRTDKWEDEKAYCQFMGAFYDIPEVNGIAIPTENLRRSVLIAARTTREGPKVEKGLAVTEPAVRIIYDGPRTPQELWDAGPEWRLTRMIRSRSGASPTTYPIFREWAVIAPYELDPDQLNANDLRGFAERAGKIEGLGASRKQGYGRYDGLIETP